MSDSPTTPGFGQTAAGDPDYTGELDAANAADVREADAERERRRAELQAELAELDKAAADAAVAATAERAANPGDLAAIAADPAGYGQNHSSGSLEHPETAVPADPAPTPEAASGDLTPPDAGEGDSTTPTTEAADAGAGTAEPAA